MVKVAINGFGRIGRLFFRQAFENENIEIVAINDLGDIENLAYLLKYDSAYRTYHHDVRAERDGNTGASGEIVVDGRRIKVFQQKDPATLPWKELDIDVVVEATGIFTTFEKASIHTEVAGAKHVVISAPAKDDDGTNGGKTVLMGVNGDELKTCSISSNGSCTTNAAAPLVAILDAQIGIEKAFLTTVHGYTATQALVDGPARGKDFRKSRAAAQNIIPSTTGAAISVTRAVKNLAGKFDGIAMRVPVITGSLIDLTFVAKKDTSVEEVNSIFEKTAQSQNWKDILAVTKDQLVSSDIIASPYGSIVDLSYTKVVGGNLVKVLAWYDNEWGYTTTLVQHVLLAGQK